MERGARLRVNRGRASEEIERRLGADSGELSTGHARAAHRRAGDNRPAALPPIS